MNSNNGSRKIVIGLGSGRSGTASLTALIDRQTGGVCFHEMNPSGAVFEGNPRPLVNTVVEFRQLLDGGSRAWLSIDYSRPSSVKTYEKLQSIPRLNVIGDIAFYYLNYVDDLLAAVPECIFICMRRDRAQTISSWLKKTSIHRWPSLKIADRLKSWITRTPYYKEYNYWQRHDGSHWMPDPVWDSCFPKFEAGSKEQAIGMYWDHYYLVAEGLEKKHPDNFRIFDVGDLGNREGQRRMLSFIGFSEDFMVLSDSLHLHQID